MTRFLLGLAMIALAAPSAAQTPAIEAARQAGAVGERYDGYMGYAAAPSAMLRSQVETINIRRREEEQSQTQTPPDEKVTKTPTPTPTPAPTER